MKILKILCGFGFLAVLVEQYLVDVALERKPAGSMTTSAICGRRICSRNLASAASTPTSSSTTIDYLKNKLKAIGFPEWNDVKRSPCHTWIPAADKYVHAISAGHRVLRWRCFPRDFR